MGPPETRQRFEEIYMTHYSAVSSYVTRRTVSPDDIADVIAETFMTAWRRLTDIPSGDEARLWLYGVARRVLANHYRAESRRTALAIRLRENLTLWAESVVDQPHDAARAAFSRLSDEDRELLSLVGWEGLGTAEIAKVLGCSRGAVRIRLHRARKRLAAELATAELDLTRYGTRAVALAKESS
ncbi:RNA polymerase sigma factor [Streptosporangium sp. NPDC000396]|uniref:RNA polymerase sigma factor n=1 Tax=Streptosporangium sp. NPDC000396 TaxID=3366185 RepID=UPI00369CC9CF